MKFLDHRSISRRDFIRLLMLCGGGFIASCNRRSIPGYSETQPSSGNHSGTISSTPAVNKVTQNPTADFAKKINTIVILLQENHSFDSLFAGFPGADGSSAPNACSDPLKGSSSIIGSSTKFDCSYSEVQIPNYWELARSFTLCDNYFSDVRGPSFPNYLMLTCAQSPIRTDPNPPFECPKYCFDLPSIANRLDENGISWHDYGGLFANIKSLTGRPEISYKKLDGFFEQAAAGTLSSLTWIGAYLVGGTKESGHPPASICTAENFAVDIINASMSSPQWESMLLILIWDEWGGFYDHVNPPLVERFSNELPFRYGYRVPCLVISPYSRAGYVSHMLYSHVSTLRTIESIFGLEPLTKRDASANSLLDCLDINQSPISPFTLADRNCSV